MMISAISQKIYETLSQDSVLRGLLPNVKDSSNIWEMRVPDPVTDNKYPLIVFRVVTVTPLLSIESLDALNWFVEIDIVGNKASMINLYTIFDRVYALLQTSNMSSNFSKAYKCNLDFMTTEYDKQTLSTFILTRWQIYSIDFPSTKLSNS